MQYKNFRFVFFDHKLLQNVSNFWNLKQIVSVYIIWIIDY